jgi:hypothetical protein
MVSIVALWKEEMDGISVAWSLEQSTPCTFPGHGTLLEKLRFHCRICVLEKLLLPHLRQFPTILVSLGSRQS